MARTYILARNYAAARDYAKSQGLPASEWTYVNDAAKLMGAKQGTTILALVGWHLAFSPKQACELVAHMQARSMNMAVVTK